jgi:reductive dehalogenase
MPPVDAFPKVLADYYKKHPEIYELDKLRMESIMPKKMRDREKYGDYYTLIDAWSSCWRTSVRITEPPEISDFQESGPMGGGRKLREPVPFKSPEMASKLIKKVTHHFGATMVGITKLNPNWCYNYDLRGSKDRGPYEVPKHWEYVIAFGVPHQWEQVQSNPNAGTSFDAYARVSIAARRLENFIKSLGYPARRHSPMDGYDLIAVPVLVEAGLGQQGRHGIVITPETGSNFRSAFVTTNLPMEIDKPIDFGVNEFCNNCKICAEICPSSSISFEPTNEGMNTRGCRHWEINQTSCYNFWMQSMGGMGCRLCLIACPYSRKSNWAHTLARAADTRDPTGIVNKALTWMQKTFFKTPEASEYLPPPDGRFATFREPPEWLSVEKYLDLKALDPTKGG